MAGGLSSSAAPATAEKAIVEESLELFADRTLCALFKLTLKDDGRHDLHGLKLIYLPGLRAELEDQGRELRIDVDLLDQALVEAVPLVAPRKPLDYLLPCWKRVQRLYRGFKRTKEDDPRFNVICEARRICLSYCLFATTVPEIFGFVFCLYSVLFLR